MRRRYENLRASFCLLLFVACCWRCGAIRVLARSLFLLGQRFPLVHKAKGKVADDLNGHPGVQSFVHKGLRHNHQGQHDHAQHLKGRRDIV